jgi:hypothetical protein
MASAGPLVEALGAHGKGNKSMLQRLALDLVISPPAASARLQAFPPLAVTTHRFQVPCPHCIGTTGFVAEAVAPAVLVAAIVDAIGSRTFSSRELLRHAEVVEGPLRAALGNLTAKQLGKLLLRLAVEGTDFDGATVEQVGDNRHQGMLWAVRLRV